jgi:dihydroorotate dehydrogenase electron transfer subunit
VLGFNTADEVFYEEEFSQLCDTIVTTADGSRGVKGFVTAVLNNCELRTANYKWDYDALYTCGPESMLKAVCDNANHLPPGHAQFSFERRMGCGFGACMVCSCKVVAGYKRICKDGPILAKEEILW